MASESESISEALIEESSGATGEMFSPPPAPEIPDVVVEPPKPPRRKHRKTKAAAQPTGTPDVDPLPPPPPDVPPLFAGGAPAPDVAPPPVSVGPAGEKGKRKIKIDPKKFAKKAAGVIDDGAQWLASARYGDLTAQIPAGEGQVALVRIRDLAQTTEPERQEVADALEEVIREWGIEVTPEWMALAIVLYTYGKRGVAMEGLARAAKANGTLGGSQGGRTP